MHAGHSLHLSPDFRQVRLKSGMGEAVIQCILDNEDLQYNGAFSWSGPALNDGALQTGHASTTLENSGTVSTLTIYNVVASDRGQYNCSYAGARASTSLVVVGTYLLHHAMYTVRTYIILCVIISLQPSLNWPKLLWLILTCGIKINYKYYDRVTCEHIIRHLFSFTLQQIQSS